MYKKFVIWAYMVEVLAAALILACLLLWAPLEDVVSFIRLAAIDIATLFGAVLFAAALGFLWSFYTKADTEFYRWLDEKGALSIYVNATLFTVLVSFLATAGLVVTKHIPGDELCVVACYFLLLAIINLYSLVSNVAGIMRLNAKFNSMKRAL